MGIPGLWPYRRLETSDQDPSPLCSCSLPGSRHSLGLGATICEMRSVVKPPLRLPPALTFFTHAGP